MPLAHRFTAACWLARLLAPVLWLMPDERVRRALLSDSRLIQEDRPKDVALYLLLLSLTARNIAVRPSVRVEGEEILEDALRGAGPRLILGPHTDLGMLLFWCLEQRSSNVVVLAAGSMKTLCGGRSVETLAISRAQLVRTFAKLREGATIAACLTRTDPVGLRVRTYDVPQGRVMLDDALLRIGIECRARFYFIAGYLGPDNEVVLRMGRPDPSASSAQDYAREFVRFSQEFLLARDGRQQPDAPFGEADEHRNDLASLQRRR